MSANTLRPPEIAREALRRLALERIPPTPDNYRTYYHDIAGTPVDEAFPEKPLRHIAGALPRDTPEKLRLANQFEHAVASRQWSAVKQAVLALCEIGPGSQPQWGALIRELLSQLQHAHNGLTVAHKRRALDQVLGGAMANADVLYLRLQGLLRGWARHDSPVEASLVAAELAVGDGSLPAEAATLARSLRAAATTPADEPPGNALGSLVAALLRKGVARVLADDPEFARQACELADAFESAGDNAASDHLSARVTALNDRLEWAAQDQRAVRHALLKLLQLIVANISELVIDDRWLRGQLDLLNEALSGPLDIRMLDEIERRLHDVIDKQGHLKRQLSDAQARLKDMLVGFVDRLAGFSTSTGRYHETLARCARQIEQAQDLPEIATVVDEMLQETRIVQETARRSSAELAALREEVESANQHIARLQRELDETSELVRHDPLTGVLNRKGLDEALTREIARAHRRGAPLCLALLDIDDFKRLNDTFGHHTGDDALRHLSTVMRDALRPHDLIGRYGGEEFLILLPDTDAQQSAEIITRLQRELTRRFFLADNRRLLITFSAGIACLAPDEASHDAIDRADRAMYAAKRAGKNRVLLAG